MCGLSAQEISYIYTAWSIPRVYVEFLETFERAVPYIPSCCCCLRLRHNNRWLIRARVAAEHFHLILLITRCHIDRDLGNRPVRTSFLHRNFANLSILLDIGKRTNALDIGGLAFHQKEATFPDWSSCLCCSQSRFEIFFNIWETDWYWVVPKVLSQ